MNTDSPHDQLEQDLKAGAALISSISPLVDEAVKQADAWLDAKGKTCSNEWAVIRAHADKLRTHSAALAQRFMQLDSPFSAGLFAVPTSSSIRDAGEAHNHPRRGHISDPAVIEKPEPGSEGHQSNDDAGNVGNDDHVQVSKRNHVLETHDLREAYCYETELRALFDFKFIDLELDQALLPALEIVLALQETGEATPLGMVVTFAETLMKGHPRGFGRYFSGVDRPWPRPSHVIQAEIDKRTPDYLDSLQLELSAALQDEAEEDGGEDER
jgi:hypothetical protein